MLGTADRLPSCLHLLGIRSGGGLAARSAAWLAWPLFALRGLHHLSLQCAPARTCCCRWLPRYQLAISRQLCSVAVSDEAWPIGEMQAWKDMPLTITASRRRCWPGGSGVGGAPTSAAERLCCQTVAGLMCVFVCVDVYVWSQNVC